MAMLSIENLEIPSDVFTLEGFRTWVATLDESAPLVSYYDGQVHVEMSPQNYRSHAPLVAQVASVLTQLANESDKGMLFMAPSWFTCEEADLSTEPDGFFVSFDSLEAGLIRIHPEREHEMVGRPDMVLEAVSKTSRKKDQRDMRAGYAAAGVPEYWLVDALGPELDFQLLVLTGGSYVAQAQDADGWAPSPVWERSFRLTRFENRAGLTDFRLEAR